MFGIWKQRGIKSAVAALYAYVYEDGFVVFTYYISELHVRTSTLVEGRANQGKGHKKKGSTGPFLSNGISRNKRK